MNLARKLRQWQEAGLIDSAGAERIAAFERGGHRPVMLYALGGLGAFAIGIGIISIVAANWSGIGPSTKLGADLALGLALAAGTFHAVRRDLDWYAEVLLLLYYLFTLASLGLVGQVFQSGTPHEPVLHGVGVGAQAGALQGVGVGTFGVLVAGGGGVELPQAPALQIVGVALGVLQAGVLQGVGVGAFGVDDGGGVGDGLQAPAVQTVGVAVGEPQVGVLQGVGVGVSEVAVGGGVGEGLPHAPPLQGVGVAVGGEQVGLLQGVWVAVTMACGRSGSEPADISRAVRRPSASISVSIRTASPTANLTSNCVLSLNSKTKPSTTICSSPISSRIPS
jgi:hypothetical protein